MIKGNLDGISLEPLECDHASRKAFPRVFGWWVLCVPVLLQFQVLLPGELCNPRRVPMMSLIRSQLSLDEFLVNPA